MRNSGLPPWEVVETFDAGKRPVFEIVSSDGRSIADILCGSPGESHDAHGPESRADAVLIARAPDLLAALRAFAAHYEEHKDSDPIEIVGVADTFYDTARALLARIEGAK